MKRFIPFLALAVVLILAGTASAHGRHGYRSQSFSSYPVYQHRAAFFAPYYQPVYQPVYVAPVQPLYVQPIYTAPVYVAPVQPVQVLPAPAPVLAAPVYAPAFTAEQHQCVQALAAPAHAVGYTQPLVSYQGVLAFSQSAYFQRLAPVHRERVFRAFPRLRVDVKTPRANVRIGH